MNNPGLKGYIPQFPPPEYLSKETSLTTQVLKDISLSSDPRNTSWTKQVSIHGVF